MTRLPCVLRTAAAAALLASALPAAADTLAEALASAYATNPELAVQRAIVRQTDELVPIALSGGRPTATATVSGQQTGYDFSSDGGQLIDGGVSLNQSLYRGGRTRLAVTAAENRILAARARLRSIENRVLLDVVTAYADVLRYVAVVDLNKNQVKVLERELQASRDRFEVGDLTRTDVAQSQARLANAVSQLRVAEGQYDVARNAYVRVVGRPPVDLEYVPPLPPLPGTLGQATDLANANNPALLAARFDEAAARYDVTGIERERLPSAGVSVGTDYSRFYGGNGGFSSGNVGGLNGSSDSFSQTAGVSLTVPLYQAGLNGARIRQAQAIRSQAMEQIGVVGRAAVETADNAFVSVATARAVITASQASVDANTLALEGVTQENQVGTRTVLEVLNAQQELLVAKVNLVTARRDEYVAGYTLLAAVGQAEGDTLAVPGPRYDATANAAAVRRKWGDWNQPANAPALPLPDAERASRSVPFGPPKP